MCKELSLIFIGGEETDHTPWDHVAEVQHRSTQLIHLSVCVCVRPDARPMIIIMGAVSSH